MDIDRRSMLKTLSAAFSATLLARCGGEAGAPTTATTDGGDAGAEDPGIEFEPPRLLSTTLRAADGGYVRSFEGIAAPQNLRFRRTDGRWVRLYDLFPGSADPFAVSTALTLGAGGYGLSILDRAASGVMPPAARDPWALEMVPFGVAIDGALMDPSGPWYDGGPADPNNPFDRKCSGWEYDPIFASVAAIVGVPLEARGHTQPSGQFHYHGYPELLVENLRHARAGTAAAARPLLLGWSSDGYPVYDCVIPAAANASGKAVHLFSGYVLRSGTRTAVPHTNPALVPPGNHDGTYVQDWVYDPSAKRALVEAALRDRGSYLGLTRLDLEAGRAELRLLDAGNGLSTEGLTLGEYDRTVYAYVLTHDWPEIPRLLAFQPSDSFRQVIPFDSPRGGRVSLYDACTGALEDVHTWNGRPRY